MRPSITVFAPGFALVLPLLLGSCSVGGVPHSPPRRLVIFIDQSASIDRAQRGQWQTDAERILAGLAGGWSLTVYAIHDQTSDAAPLFDGEVPDWSEDATFDAASAQKANLMRIRHDATAAVRKALDVGGGATQTDLFGGIDRVRVDAKRRPTTIVYFSDMLNSTPELNMERANSLTRARIPEHIQNLARRHQWRPDTLAGAEIYCVLNSIESGRHGPAVDRLTQRSFYETLFRALGARLAVYDTHLGSLGIDSLAGGNHAAQTQ